MHGRRQAIQPRRSGGGRHPPSCPPIGERGQGSRDAVKQRGSLLLGGLDRVPVGLDAFGAVDRSAGEDVRVSSDELVHDVLCHLVDAPRVVGMLFGQPGVKDHLQQQVAELLAQMLTVARVQGLEHLIGLLEQVCRQARMRLPGIPRAAAGRAQPVHHGHQILHGDAGGGR